MSQFRVGNQTIPPVIKNLLIINGLFFLATFALEQFNINLRTLLGLHYFEASDFNPYQFITYMFMHGDLMHIFFNMFALWMFGAILETYWGSKRFLFYYMVTGIGAGLIHLVTLYFELNPFITSIDLFLENPSVDLLNSFVSTHKFFVDRAYTPDLWELFEKFSTSYTAWQSDVSNTAAKIDCINFITSYREYYLNLPNFSVVGASGAVYGVLLAFGMMFPNAPIYLYFAIPIKAKYLVVLYGGMELVSGIVNARGDNVAHFAHLGGMIFGLALILYWRYSHKR